MHRNNLIRLLDNYSPQGADELVYKTQIYNFIQNHDNCFDRSCILGHVTASIFLLDYDLSNVLLMHHKKLGIWLQLGGHCDGASEVVSVALKEAQEESGINMIELLSDGIFDLDVHLVPAFGNDHAHYHYDIRFVAKVSEPGLVIKPNSESIDMKWFPISGDNLPTKDRSIIRMFEKIPSVASVLN